MKKLLIAFLAFSLISSLAFADDKVKWLSFEEAEALNKVEPRKFLIDVYTDWCGWCKRMDKDTYANPIIAKYINENYYPIKFDAETKDTIEFAGHSFVSSNQGRRPPHMLAVSLMGGRMSYPTTLIMNEDIKLLDKIPGYLDPWKIEPILNFYVENGHQNMPFEDYVSTFVSTLPTKQAPKPKPNPKPNPKPVPAPKTEMDWDLWGYYLNLWHGIHKN